MFICVDSTNLNKMCPKDSFSPHRGKPQNNMAICMCLDLVDKLRETMAFSSRMYKGRITRAYNTRACLRKFQVGDLVTRKANAVHPISKLDPKWKDPYKIAEIVNTRAHHLQ